MPRFVFTEYPTRTPPAVTTWHVLTADNLPAAKREAKRDRRTNDVLHVAECDKDFNITPVWAWTPPRD